MQIKPNHCNLKSKNAFISCARTGARPAKTAHAPLYNAHTDSVRNTAPVPVLTLLQKSRGCIQSFNMPVSSKQTEKIPFLPSSLGCQRAQTFLAPNPEQTVPFDVDDVKRTGAGWADWLSDGMSPLHGSSPSHGEDHAIPRNDFQR